MNDQGNCINQDDTSGHIFQPVFEEITEPDSTLAGQDTGYSLAANGCEKAFVKHTSKYVGHLCTRCGKSIKMK